MRVLRDPQIISGFIYEEPVDEIPSLTHCGEALCCHGHARPSHVHPGFEFLYLARGSCDWNVRGKVFQQKMGDLFIAHPGEAHSTGPNPENRHIWMGLRLAKLGPNGERLARELRRRNIHLLTGCQEAEPLLNAIINQVVLLRPQRSEVIMALLHAFVALVAQQRACISGDRKMENNRAALPYSFAVQRTIAYMRRNLDRRIPLRDLSVAATIRSTPQLCSLFHQEVGVTPAHYHVQLRLEAAREALRQQSNSITEVALQFGFSSSQHFSTLFRSAFGLTPRKWRCSR